MMTIWEHMYNGMGAAAWVCGFLILLGGCLILIGVVGCAVLTLLKSDDPDGEEANGDGERVDPFDAGYPTADGAHANARRVGRHVGKGAV